MGALFTLEDTLMNDEEITPPAKKPDDRVVETRGRGRSLFARMYPSAGWYITCILVDEDEEKKPEPEPT